MSDSINQLNKMEEQEPSIDYGKLFKDLMKYKKKYFKVLFITFVATCIISVSIPGKYKGTVTLSPEMSGSKSTGGLAALASSFGVNLKGALGNSTEALFPTLYPDLMNSTEFKAGLFAIPVTIEGDKDAGEPDRTMTYYEYLKDEQKKAWWSAAIWGSIKWLVSLIKGEEESEPETIDPFRLTEKQTEIMMVLDKKIICDVDNKTMVISIEVTDQNPVICATMADSVKVRLQKAITDYRTSKARVDLEYNKKMFAEAKQRYEKATDAYVRFADGNQKVFLQTVRQKTSKLEDEMQLQRTIYQQLASQVQQAEMQVQEATPAFTTLQNATVPVIRDSPKRKRMVIISLFLAFVATSVWALNKEGYLKSFIGLS